MEIDVNSLVLRWEIFRAILTPSMALLSTEIQELDIVDRELLELGLVSSRREYWEVCVCLMSYSLATEREPGSVLRDLNSALLWNEDALETAHWPRLNDFLGYCHHFRFIIPVSFLPAAFALKISVPRFVTTPQAFYAGTLLIEECKEENPIPPQSLDDIKQCIKEGRARIRAAITDALIIAP